MLGQIHIISFVVTFEVSIPTQWVSLLVSFEILPCVFDKVSFEQLSDGQEQNLLVLAIYMVGKHQQSLIAKSG